MAQESAGNVVWHLTDHLGTVRDLVNNSGAVVNHFVYDSFGQVISESNPAIDTRYLFTGREFDQEIGLYYYRARYYDANTGRFISKDPKGKLFRNPKAPDGGTAFQPTSGKSYFDNLR
ncbi:RHS repeat-associated core domain-containing protein [Okeanomitos corallinicola TIOX110]|uniref:RHS repeat-associated core domain-containing protein n=1 Tax=Okeanomitos corallinicola TIOX110 TaxID=3133117 RepID=A0ABZ2UR55_9CYAN